MRGRSAELITGLVIAATVAVGTPATAKPLDKGHFHDVFTNFFTCATTGTPVQEDGDIFGSFVFNQRGGPNVFPYGRENQRGSFTWTNLDNGGTFTQVFSAVSQDHKITDNGDGTITIITNAAGGARYYDNSGKMVLRDPGNIRFAVEIDYNGTPGNPDDDQEVPGSFRTYRESTGLNETEGRDFCADIVEFSSR